MKLVLVVLATTAAARANIAYQGGLVVQGPFSPHLYSEVYPGGSYNQLGAPNPAKYQYRGVQSIPALPDVQNDVSVDPPSQCSCGRQNSGLPLAASAPPQLVYPPEYPQAYIPAPPVPDPKGNPPSPQCSCGRQNPSVAAPLVGAATQLFPSTPPESAPLPSPDPEKDSHIMKIPKKYSSITAIPPTESSVTVNPPSDSSLPATLPYPAQPIFYTRPPLLASCPATVFYPAAYTVYPPFTCPSYQFPPSTQGTTSPPPTQAAPTVTITPPKTDGKPIASFTSTVPDVKAHNETSPPDKVDPLLTFKLLSAAVAKNQETTTQPADPQVEAASKDCSMPVPPQIV